MDTLEHLNQSLFLLINADPASPAWRIQAGMFIANRLILLVPAALAGLWLGRPAAARPGDQDADRHRRGAVHQLSVRRAVAASTTLHHRPGPCLLRTQGHLLLPQQPHHHHRHAGLHAAVRPALGGLGLGHAGAGGRGRPVARLPGRALPAGHRRRPAAWRRWPPRWWCPCGAWAPRDRGVPGAARQAAGPADRARLDPRLGRRNDPGTVPRAVLRPARNPPRLRAPAASACGASRHRSR